MQLAIIYTFSWLRTNINGDTLEASKSAHLFELNAVKPMYCTDVNQVASDMVQAMPAFQITSALYVVLKQQMGRFPI